MPLVFYLLIIKKKNPLDCKKAFYFICWQLLFSIYIYIYFKLFHLSQKNNFWYIMMSHKLLWLFLGDNVWVQHSLDSCLQNFKKRYSYSQIFDRRTLIKSNSICNVKNNLYIVPTAYQIFIENSWYFFNTHLKKLLSISVFKTFQHCFSHFTLKKKKTPVSITLGKLNHKLYLIFINSLLFVINFFYKLYF